MCCWWYINSFVSFVLVVWFSVSYVTVALWYLDSGSEFYNALDGGFLWYFGIWRTIISWYLFHCLRTWTVPTSGLREEMKLLFSQVSPLNLASAISLFCLFVCLYLLSFDHIYSCNMSMKCHKTACFVSILTCKFCPFMG